MQRSTAAVLTAGVALVVGVGLTATPASAQRNSVELFISSARNLHPVAETVTLPLFKGTTATGGASWFVITESSDKKDAEARGINPAPKLTNALGTAAVQRVTVSGGVTHFAGTVDFSPTRVVVPSSPNGFPPAVFVPGAVGDAAYSPLITTGNGIVLNAPQVANATGVHDSVVSIDYAARRVTMKLFKGFYDGKRVIYLKFEGSDKLLASIEATTYAPNLNAAPGIGSDDKKTSAREAIIPAVNGPRGVNNPQRQGLESALLGQGDPLNITQEEPGSAEYSPVWDVTPYVWTNTAIARGKRHQLRAAGEVADAFAHGNVVSAPFSTGPANDSLNGLRAAGFISNCPLVAQLS